MRCTSGSGSLVMAEGLALTDCTHCGWPSVSRLFLPADDERERLVICRTIGCFSHVRTCHFGGCDTGRYALYVWQRLSAVGREPLPTARAVVGLRFHDSSSQPMTSGNALLSARRQTAHRMYAPATLGAATRADMRCACGRGSRRWVEPSPIARAVVVLRLHDSSFGRHRATTSRFLPDEEQFNLGDKWCSAVAGASRGAMRSSTS
jgi:hypothetical protein